MPTLLAWLRNASRQLSQMWESNPLTLLLLIGFTGLAVGLLIAMKTRFGQAKPLWTCAILSVLAHILLIGYAYGTKLISAVPVADDVVKFTLIEQTSSPEDPIALPPQPWELPPTEELPDEEPEATEPTIAPREQPLTQRDQELSLPGEPATSPSTPLDSNALFLAPAVEAVAPAEDVLKRIAKLDGEELQQRPPSSRLQPQLDPLIQQTTESEEPQRELPDDPIDPDEPIEIAEPAAELTSQAELVPIRPIERQLDFREQVDQLAHHDAALPPSAAGPPEPDRLTWRSAEQGRQDVEPIVSPVAAKIRRGDGKPMPQIFHARTEEKSAEWLRNNGTSVETQQAVESALKFLAATQEIDGRWDASQFGGGMEQRVLGHDRQGAGVEADTAVTALALLAFLGSGNTHLEGEHQSVVRTGLEYLIRTQHRDGNLAGNALLFSKMYCHSMATLALSEAYAMTGDPRIRASVERAVEYSIRAQHPQGGGWRYQPGDQGDMSQFGWHVLAFKSARLGGIEIPRQTWQRMQTFLQSCSSGSQGGLAAYRPGQRPSPTMTAEALVCRFFLETHPSKSTIAEAAAEIVNRSPGRGPVNYYYWYYGTLALKLSGGDPWQTWNEALVQQLSRLQVKNGKFAGSFEPNGLWCGYGGRIYSTAMATLCLESYYRYQPAIKTANNR